MRNLYETWLVGFINTRGIGPKNWISLKTTFEKKGEVNNMESKIKTTELNIKRTINAIPSEVFDAWIDPTSPRSPWCGVTKAIVNRPKADGLFYSMYQFEGNDIAHYGRFVHWINPVESNTHGSQKRLKVWNHW